MAKSSALHAAALVATLLLAVARADTQTKRIVLLQGFERGNIVLDRFTQVLRASVDEQSPAPVTFTEFVVSPAGFRDIPEAALVDFIRTAFAAQPTPDLVIATSGPGSAFVQQHRRQLFPDSPVLYAAVDETFLQGTPLREDETAVAVANQPAVIVDDIIRLFPDTRTVFVVVGAGELGRFWRQRFEKDFAKYAGRLDFMWSDTLSYAQILQRASTLPERSAIFFTSFDVDKDGSAYPNQRVLSALHDRANAPLFSAQSPELGTGVIGGTMMSVDSTARSAADAALRILGGTSPSAIKTAVLMPGPPVFDWRELRRWGVPASRLPGNSVVMFREPTLWERSKWLIIIGVTALAAQTALIGALLANRLRRRRAEDSLRESESRFRVLANSAPVMIRMAGVDGRATDFNSPWLAFTGRTVEASRGDGWIEAVHPDDAAACREAYRLALDQRKPYRMEYRLRRNDGDYRWILDTGEPRFMPDGAFSGYIGSAIDITDLKLARAALSNLNRRLLQAQEQERSRVARELHDDVCQRIAMLTMDVERIAETIPESNVEARTYLSELYEETRALGWDVNGISHRLHSSKLESLGLAPAVASLCRELSAHHDVAIEFTHHDLPAGLQEGVAVSIFRVTQEALANAIKHSGAASYRVALRTTGDDLRLEVFDNGRGFDSDAVMASSGLGLLSMQERLRLVGGEVTITSRPGAGTSIRGIVPLTRAD
jgi:PAS domain S-box-containing protein